MGDPEIDSEKIDADIDLIMRYEVMNENRFIKLVNLFKSLQF